MKVSTALLCLLLTASFSTQVLAQPEAALSQAPAALVWSGGRSPRRLESYTRVSSSQCHQEAVVFKTKLNKEVCANVKAGWVQDSKKCLDKKSPNPKP